MKFYEGNIAPRRDTIFVFGSNTEGQHLGGSACVAHASFGAEWGNPEGLQGNSYALPTVDWANRRALDRKTITANIKKMYACAKGHPDKNFKVAYRNTYSKSICGYFGTELLEMFKDAGPIPENVWFSKEWVDTGLFNK